jgi:hypothetical protein
MEGFLKAIPAAASSPYALVAYLICAIVFLFAGARLRRIKAIMQQLQHVPAAQRKEAIEIATETKLPSSISAEQWIRVNRLRWTFLIIVAAILAITTIAVIALTGARADTTGLKQQVIETGKDISGEIRESEQKVIGAVQDTAIANLETMFPLTVRIDRDVDSTILHLDGSRKQRIVSYDRNMTPMKVFWGDRFHYFAFGPNLVRDTASRANLSLEISNGTRLPLPIDTFTEAEVRIPGSTPEPMDVWLINPEGLTGIEIKITIYSADRERGREEFRRALMSTTHADRVRSMYLEVYGDGVRLRSEPGESGHVLRLLSDGTYVKVLQTTNGWSQVRLPEGREGWVSRISLRAIQ